MTPISGGTQQRAVRRAVCTAALIALVMLMHGAFNSGPASGSRTGHTHGVPVLHAVPTIGTAATAVGSASAELPFAAASGGHGEGHGWRSGTASPCKPRHTASAATAVAPDSGFGGVPPVAGRHGCVPEPVDRAGPTGTPTGLVLRC